MIDNQNTDEYWMKKALLYAEQAYDQGEVPVGAVIVLDGQQVGQGWNQPISMQDATAHAEMMALRRAGRKMRNYRLAEATMYVTIEPCTMCFGAMVHARIKRLVYGAPENKSGVIHSNLKLHQESCFNHKIKIESGLMADSCSDLIQQFFKGRRSVKKGHDAM